jgi:hypothetical protein
MPMTLENTLLEKLSEWQPPPGRNSLHLNTAGWSITVQADRSDALGCLVWELQLQRDGTAEVDVAAWAAATADRITGLTEPLKVIEIDASRRQAQLRSEAPLQRGTKRLYYELLLSGLGGAILKRFQCSDAHTAREQVPFAITHETLARLAGDVAALS